MSNNQKFHQQRSKLANLLFVDSDDEKIPKQEDMTKGISQDFSDNSRHFSSSKNLEDIVNIKSIQSSKQQVYTLNNKNPNFKEQQALTFSQEYELGNTLGEGAHAIVKQCWSKDKKELFAVKITRTADIEIMENMRQTFLNTVNLNHNYIIKHYKLFIDENEETAYMIMDYCPYPSLESLLKERQKLNEKDARKIFKSLLEAVIHSHSKGICHRDIKPDNILVNTLDYTVRLTDFGVSKRFQFLNKYKYKISLMWTVTGNIHYCAPEIFHASGYNQAIDVWAIGVVLYQTLCGILPYSPDQIMEFIDQIGSTTDQEHFQNQQFKSQSRFLQDLLKRVLIQDPKKRLTPEMALLHPWFYEEKEQKKKDNKLRNLTSKDDSNSLIKKNNLNGLAFSEQYPDNQNNNVKNSKEIETIAECNYEGSPLRSNNDKFFSDIQQFKQNTQINNIHTILRDSTQKLQIDFVSSYQSMNFSQMQSQQNTMVANSKIDQILEADPFFTGSDNMKQCDSDEEFEEEEVMQASKQSSLWQEEQISSPK